MLVDALVDVAVAMATGPHEPAALAAAWRPPLERAVRAQPGIGWDVAQDTKES